MTAGEWEGVSPPGCGAAGGSTEGEAGVEFLPVSFQHQFLTEMLQWRAQTTPDHPLFLLLNAKVQSVLSCWVFKVHVLPSASWRVFKIFCPLQCLSLVFVSDFAHRFVTLNLTL